ncbi:hypothetical protein JTE90_011853 [Oedothorax gibbosus]|uniref:LolA-like domain-containing protein n=1 Tax=Oedothorax gibbosus TaxID=931172 RepID=A0AAV6V518_9ARAC|nr:hypothetical protein JTE90_011853 [Oedothorax gibbosus]
MAAVWFKLLLVASVTLLASSYYDTEICSIVKTSNGLVPPPLANNFALKGDHLDVDTKTASYQEMYVDYANNLAKFMYLLRGIEHHILFDFQVQQAVEWDAFHPGVDIKDDPISHICEATPLEDHPFHFMFGFLDPMAEHPKMHPAQKILRFGGNYPYAFDSTDQLDQRGLVVDTFTGCIYDPDIDATMQANYSFTNSRVMTSGGTTVEEVTGVDDGILSVPAHVDFFGTVMDEESRNYSTFRQTENYYWFTGEPEFEWGTFQIPPKMYCDDYRGRKDMPQLPKAFSTRVQMTDVEWDELSKMATQEVTTYEEIYYDKEKRLARRDFNPDNDLDTEVFNKFASREPVKSIFDFNTGIVYFTHKPTGRCYARPIVQGDFFENSNNSIFIQMTEPEDIFGMHTDDMEYKGQSFARDIDCDVWVGKKVVKDPGVTYIQESHFATNGWHEQADEQVEYKVPVKLTNIFPNNDGYLDEETVTLNFLKFKAAAPYLRTYDVSNCISSDTPHMDFVILLKVSDEVKKTIFDYTLQFLEAAQMYIDEYAQTFTPLRVQRLELRTMSIADTRPVLAFTLVGKHPLKTMTSVGQPGPTLEQSADLLHKFIDTNSFAITFFYPGSKDPVLVLALKGSLYVKTSDGHLQAHRFLEDEEEWTTLEDDTEEDFQNVMFDEGAEEEEKKGMSDGNLTMLALSMLFIGLGIGIAVMYLYVRKISESQLEDRITLTPQVSTVEAPPMTSADTQQ